MSRHPMYRTIAALMVTAVSCAACSEAPQPGANNAAVSSPTGWQCGATGGGKPQWTLEKDASGLQVLKQSGIAPYPWCVKPGVKLTDGFVEVRFKPIAGREDQAGGVVWRWQNGDHYYVARANALENNLGRLAASAFGRSRTA